FELPPPTALSPLSLPDALPISRRGRRERQGRHRGQRGSGRQYGSFRHATSLLPGQARVSRNVSTGSRPSGSLTRIRRGALSRSQDRKSTRLNSSHVKISYVVFW